MARVALPAPAALPVVVLLAVLFSVSCSPDRGPILPPPTGNAPLAEATVGPQGGELKSGDFVLSVPAGAFAEAATLQLHADAATDSIECPMLSDRYQIDGLPVEFAQPLRLSIRRTTGLAGQEAILIGAEAFSPTLGQTHTGWSWLPAADSSGWVQGTLGPAASTAANSTALTRRTREPSTTSVRIVAAPVDRTYTTTEGHFRIWTPWVAITESQLADLGSYLEEAYRRHQQLGFVYAARTSWPVAVSVVALAPTVDGFYSSSILGPNHGTLEFNVLSIGNLPELRVTAAHELLHMVQSFYDPRSAWAQASSGGPQYWLDEATAVWCETRHHADPNYCSSVRKNNELTPLGGVTAGLRVGDAFHGYGLSSMFRYLEQHGDSAVIPQAYQAVHGGASPIEAVRINLRTPMKSWWWDYLHDLVAGQIYRDVTPRVVERDRAGMFRITSPSDTLHTFQTSLPDLSGMLYLVRLDHPQIDATSLLKVRVTGGECEVSAFAMPDTSALVPLGRAADSLAVTGLRQLTNQGARLILLVSNRRDSSSGYTGTSPVTLNLRVVQGLDLSRFHVASLSLYYHAFWANGDGDNWEVAHQGLNFLSVPRGSFSGSTYSVVWDSTETSSGMRYKGHFQVVLDEASVRIQSWSAESRWIFPMPGTQYTYICEGGAMNLTRRGATELAYDLFGTAACGPVTRVYVQQMSEGRVTVQTQAWDCNAESSLAIRLYADGR